MELTKAQKEVITALLNCNPQFYVEVKEDMQIRPDGGKTTVHTRIFAWRRPEDEPCTACGHTHFPPNQELTFRWNNYRFLHATAFGFPEKRRRRSKLSMSGALSYVIDAEAAT